MYPLLHHRLGIRNIRDTASSGKRSREHNKAGAGGIKRSNQIDNHQPTQFVPFTGR